MDVIWVKILPSHKKINRNQALWPPFIQLVKKVARSSILFPYRAGSNFRMSKMIISVRSNL